MKRLLYLAATLSVACPVKAQVRNYGPLILNFSQAKQMEGSIVVPAKNSKGQPIYVAAFCEERLFNFTGAEFEWSEWSKRQRFMSLKLWLTYVIRSESISRHN